HGARFRAAQLGWLFAVDPGAASQLPITPAWSGDDQATLALQPSSGPSLVLFKESLFPGWSARLVTPAGSQPVDLVGGEMDFMLASLPSVPAGSSLVFRYGPTVFEEASWWLSLVFLAVLISWVLRPALLSRGADLVAGTGRSLLSPVARRVERWDEDA